MRNVNSNFRVLDSLHEDGAKLVRMSPEVANVFKAHQPGVRIVPVVYFKVARHRYEIEGRATARGRQAIHTTIRIVAKDGGAPIKGAHVVAFTDFDERLGAQGTTTGAGTVKLDLGEATRLERLYVYGPDGYWGAFRKNVNLSGNLEFAIAAVDLSIPDSRRHYYPGGALTDGRGVTVGVIDTGIGPHPDLVVAGGRNTVLGENATDFGDNGDGHGTHVAGIIAARGTLPTGLRGIAPGVTLRSYRVFAAGQDASNFAIMKAIEAATADGCDIINLSLGGPNPDLATGAAIHKARQNGVLVFGATGNDDRSPVSFPAADSLCLAVTAMGRKGTFPKGSVEEADVVSPFGTDADEFIAAFSNVGGEVDLTGPGAGIVSTVPGGYSPMSGTSMACPAVAGFAAKILADSPILAMSRNQARSDAMAREVMLRAVRRGFTAEMEGNGLPLS